MSLIKAIRKTLPAVNAGIAAFLDAAENKENSETELTTTTGSRSDLDKIDDAYLELNRKRAARELLDNPIALAHHVEIIEAQMGALSTKLEFYKQRLNKFDDAEHSGECKNFPITTDNIDIPSSSGDEKVDAGDEYDELPINKKITSIRKKLDYLGDIELEAADKLLVGIFNDSSSRVFDKEAFDYLMQCGACYRILDNKYKVIVYPKDEVISIVYYNSSSYDIKSAYSITYDNVCALSNPVDGEEVVNELYTLLFG